MIRRVIFFLARIQGRVWFIGKVWWGKLLAIFAICVVIAYSVDLVYPKLPSLFPKPPEKSDPKSKPPPKEPRCPEIIRIFATSLVTTSVEPKEIEIINPDTGKAEVPAKDQNNIEITKTEIRKTATNEIELINENTPSGPKDSNKAQKPSQKNGTGGEPTGGQKKDQKILFSFWKIVALYALALFFWWGIRSRKQLVVEAFTTYKGDKKPSQEDPLGLGALLAIELDRLKRLFQAVDEQRTVSTATGVQHPLSATFKGEDVSSLLKGAVSAEMKLELGFFKIPVGSLMALLGLIFQGPRIRGSLHQEKVGDKWERYTLAAQLVGGDRPVSWLVMREFPAASSAEGGKEKVGKPEGLNYGLLVEELAYRVFTDLALPANIVRWEATRALSEGLRAYRECLRTPKDRSLNLKRAEHHLMEAISIDETMDLALYNLGVVYKELGMREAALAAFTRTTEMNKDRWEPVYGIAREYYNKMKKKEDYDKTFKEAIEWCERVIELQPDNIKVFALEGLAYLYKAISTENNPIKKRNQKDSNSDFEDSIKFIKKALDLSRRAFLKGVRRGEFASVSDHEVMRQRSETFLACLYNLSMANLESAKAGDNAKKRKKQWKKAQRLLNAAFYFQTFNKLKDEYLFSYLHYAQARIFYEGPTPDFVKAEDCFRKSLRIDPNDSKLWAYLALVLYKAKKPHEEIWMAWNNVLDWLKPDDDHRIKEMKDIKELIKKEPDRDDIQIPDLVDFLNDIKDQENNWSYLNSIYSDPEKYQYNGWRQAQVAIKLGQWYLKNYQPDEAEKYFQDALEKLESNYPQGIRSQKLPACLAQCWRYSDTNPDKSKALEKIKNYLVEDPLSSSLRKELGILYFSLCRFAESLDTLEDALFWDPDDPEIYYYLGLANFHLIHTTHDPAQGDLRKQGLEKAVEHLKNTLILYGPEKTVGLEGIEKTHKIGQTHYWLGKVHLELNMPGAAITNLMIAGNLQAALEQASSEQASLEEGAPEQAILQRAILEQTALDEASLEQLTQIQLVPQQANLEGVTAATLPSDKKIPPDIQLLLGMAFLKNKNFNEAESLFRDLISQYESQPEKSELLLWARLFYAFSLTERRGDLKKAFEQVQKAKKGLESLKSKSENLKLEAFCSECKGWIYYKQDNIDLAKENLERAIALWAEPGSYYRLALAYETKPDDIKDKSLKPSPTNQRLLLKKAEEYCRQAEDLDFGQEYKDRLQALKNRLEKHLKAFEKEGGAEETSEETNKDV